MIAYLEGKVLAVSKEGFDDREGVRVEYFVNVIKTAQGVMTFNSKRDYSEFEGVEGILSIRLTEDSEKKNRFKVSLVEVRKGETLGMPEGEVE